MIRTMYGDIPKTLLVKFCKIAGYVYDRGKWNVISNEVEYWQLVAPGSNVEDKKWQKKLGWLPIRDYNFEYACYQCPKIVKSEMSGKTLKVFDLEKAIEYVKDKLMVNGEPVYLPELLAEKADPTRDQLKKPPKSYNKILLEEKENFENR